MCMGCSGWKVLGGAGGVSGGAVRASCAWARGGKGSAAQKAPLKEEGACRVHVDLAPPAGGDRLGGAGGVVEEGRCTRCPGQGMGLKARRYGGTAQLTPIVINVFCFSVHICHLCCVKSCTSATAQLTPVGAPSTRKTNKQKEVIKQGRDLILLYTIVHTCHLCCVNSCTSATANSETVGAALDPQYKLLSQ